MSTKAFATFPTCETAALSICAGTSVRTPSPSGTTSNPGSPVENPWTRRTARKEDLTILETNSDKILISELGCLVAIGVTPKERSQKQRLSIDVEFTLDTRPAARTDSIRDTIDYSLVARSVVDVCG